MKRGWTILLAGALVLAIALPVGAVKPNCEDLPTDHPLYCPPPPQPPPTPTTTTTPDTSTTTTTPDPPAGVDCEFNADGILLNPWSEADEPYRCRWTTSDRGPEWSFTFHLTAGSEDDEGSVLRPHMFVTDSYPYGDKCFTGLDNGWHDLEYSLDESYAWESFSLPADGECDDSFPEEDPDGADSFSLVIAARVKGITPPNTPMVTVVKEATAEVTVTQP